MTPTTTDRDPTIAAPCADCRTTGGTPLTGPSGPRRRRGYCDRCYQRHQRDRDITFRYVCYATRPAPLPAVVTPAMLGITPGQPPTDAGLTPRRVREVGNTNVRRTLAWFAAHTDLDATEVLDRAIWTPATLAIEHAAAA